MQRSGSVTEIPIRDGDIPDVVNWDRDDPGALYSMVKNEKGAYKQV